jgi:glycosyltransferase involved in cell wall biosynthesis
MDVFVFLPAVQEGFGLSLLEAMAAGKPIVSVRRGIGAAWVLDKQGIGLTVEPDRPDQLARAVVRVLQDPVEAQRLGQRAQELARTRYDLGQVLDQVEAVYAECLNQTSPARRSDLTPGRSDVCLKSDV